VETADEDVDVDKITPPATVKLKLASMRPHSSSKKVDVDDESRFWAVIG
jgi:hypothetical protein